MLPAVVIGSVFPVFAARSRLRQGPALSIILFPDSSPPLLLVGMPNAELLSLGGFTLAANASLRLPFTLDAKCRQSTKHCHGNCHKDLHGEQSSLLVLAELSHIFFSLVNLGITLTTLFSHHSI